MTPAVKEFEKPTDTKPVVATVEQVRPSDRHLVDLLNEQMPKEQAWVNVQAHAEDPVLGELPPGFDKTAYHAFWIVDKDENVARWQSGTYTSGIPCYLVSRKEFPDIPKAWFVGGPFVKNRASNLVLLFMPISKWKEHCALRHKEDTAFLNSQPRQELAGKVDGSMLQKGVGSPLGESLNRLGTNLPHMSGITPVREALS